MKIVDVEITENNEVIGNETHRSLIITPVWDDVDRPRSFSWGVKATHRRLAERLKAAILAGVVFHDIEKKTDSNGKTYASCTSRVWGRRMNADLTRLGY